jgi:hypothetical protein
MSSKEEVEYESDCSVEEDEESEEEDRYTSCRRKCLICSDCGVKIVERNVKKGIFVENVIHVQVARMYFLE